MSGTRANIMLVEHERQVAASLRDRLARLGYNVPSVASSANEAVRMARQAQPDVVLMEMSLDGEMSGIDAALMLGEFREAPLVYLTDHPDDALNDRARATRPYGYLQQPFSEQELDATLQMVLARRRAELALERSEARRQLVLDITGMGTLEMSADLHDAVLDARAAALFGLDPVEGSRPWPSLMDRVAPAHRPLLQGAIEKHLRRITTSRLEFQIDIAEGRSRWLRLHARTIVPGPTKPFRIVCALEDLTGEIDSGASLARIHAEIDARVAERTRELATRIEYLDSFTQSVAHDLRAPIRHIRGFTDLLMVDAEHASGRRRADLMRIRDSAEHLDRMITSLLTLSEQTHVSLNRSKVDLSAIAHRIAGRFLETEPGRDITFDIAPGIWAYADPDLIEDVLDNLIDNAWKYTARRAGAEIRFSQTLSANGAVYSLADNGVGFNPPKDTDIFHPFKRYHRASEFPGTGVGLSSAQRIVNSHGGKLWVRSAPGEGCTFYFSLPAQPAASRRP
jgi:signal transduction histidine kinase